jgi:Fe-S cluster biogenesis protein NfuA
MIDKIEDVLDKYVRPELSKHYGDVKVISFKDGILEISLIGQCSNCPSSNLTVESIVEKEVMKYVPEVKRIALVSSISDDLLEQARKILHKEF